MSDKREEFLKSIEFSKEKKEQPVDSGAVFLNAVMESNRLRAESDNAKKTETQKKEQPVDAGAVFLNAVMESNRLRREKEKEEKE